MIEHFERLILDQMITDGIIPEQNIFDITEDMLSRYILTYSAYNNKNGKGLKTKSQRRFARRLAGLTLLKLNFERGAKFTDLACGVVYMISNPAFPDHVKIGITTDLSARLAIYQTYDPYRRFKVIKYDFVLNRVDKERQILEHPDTINELGEWIKKENANSVFERICFRNGKDLVIEEVKQPKTSLMNRINKATELRNKKSLQIQNSIKQ